MLSTSVLRLRYRPTVESMVVESAIDELEIVERHHDDVDIDASVEWLTLADGRTVFGSLLLLHACATELSDLELPSVVSDAVRGLCATSSDPSNGEARSGSVPCAVDALVRPDVHEPPPTERDVLGALRLSVSLATLANGLSTASNATRNGDLVRALRELSGALQLSDGRTATGARDAARRHVRGGVPLVADERRMLLQALEMLDDAFRFEDSRTIVDALCTRVSGGGA